MEDYEKVAGRLGLHDVTFIPISALQGDNIVARSHRTPWYEGLPLLEKLELVDTPMPQSDGNFRFPVQAVLRSNNGFRGYAGQITCGTIHPDDEVLALPSERRLRVSKIFNFTRDLREALAPMSVVVSLGEETDLGRGDMLCDSNRPPAKAKRLRAKLIWMSSTALQLEEPYLMKHTSQIACMSVVRLLHKIDIGTLQAVSGDSLTLNEIGEAEIETHKAIFCDPYSEDRATGSFVVIHPISNKTVAAGIIYQAYEQSSRTLASTFSSVSRTSRQGLTVWATGLSGAGKTTICNAVHTELLARGLRVEVLDGDMVRQHLSRELGFSKADRDENVRRIGFVADLLTRNGIIALVSAISPYRSLREEIRGKIGRFLEVYVNAPLPVCEQRDPRGFYKSARTGTLRGFTGIDDPYEPPLAPEVECRTDIETKMESVDKVVSAILKTI
jgi:bifunctional enzyme CysN/CysC